MPARNLREATIAAFPEFTERQLQVLQGLLFAPKYASSATQLRTLLGLSAVVQVNKAIGDAGRTVFQHLKRHPDGFHEGEFEWWTIVATGEPSHRKGFIWTLRPAVVFALSVCGLSSQGHPGPDEVLTSDTLTEGAQRTVLVNAYERNPVARAQCIEHHQAVCVVCGFSFGAIYGQVAEGFIHVHHLRPLNTIGQAYEVDPLTDLVPVCPNCHAVMHMTDPPYTVEQVRAFIARQQGGR